MQCLLDVLFALIAQIFPVFNSRILSKVNLVRKTRHFVDISCEMNSDFPDGVDDVLLLSYTHVMFVIIPNSDISSCYLSKCQ